MAKALINPARPAWSGGRGWLLRPALGLLLGGAALGWAVWGLDGTALVQTLGATSPGWLLVALLGVLAVAGAKAARWGALFGDAPARPKLATLFWALVAAQSLNLLIPIRLGELARLGLLKQRGAPVSVTLSTIVAEKTLDLAGLGLIAAGLTSLALTPPWLSQSSDSLLALGLLLTAALLAGWRLRAKILAGLASLSLLPASWRSRLLPLLETTLAALAPLARPRLLVRVVVWSALIWVFSALTMIAVLAAFQLALPLTVALILMVAINLSNIAPSPPALMGLMQGITVAVLIPYGVEQAVAVSVGLWLNLITVGPLLLLGGWAWRGRVLELLSLLRRPPALTTSESV